MSIQIFDNRVELLSLVPRDAICAELGVAYGGFAQTIIEQTSPRKLTLIDSWEGGLGERRWPKIRDSFIGRAGIEVFRGRTLDVVHLFEDEYFDWIYVDASHEYRDVLADITAYYRTVKRGGLILGHDFGAPQYPFPTHLAFGLDVVRAVIECMQEFNMEMVGLCTDYEKHPLDKGRWECSIPSFAMRKQ